MLPSPTGWPAYGLGRLLRGLSLLFSILFVLLFVLVAWRRLHYPFEVDRMESGMLTSVWRLRHGYALYSPPSLQWAPFLYAPLFFYVSAAVSHLTGLNYGTLRLVSATATLGSFAMIFALVRVETRGRWQPALYAVGLFACLYAYVLAWYDVGRVDALALFFFLAALLATRCTHPLLAAVVWLAAFLTKQTFLPLGFAIFLIEWRRPRRMLLGMGAYLLLVGGSIAYLQQATHGWFRYYAFGTAGVIRWSFHTAVMFPFADLLGPLPITCGLVLLAALLTKVPWRQPEGSYLALVTVLLGGAIWYVRAHVGANINAIIPLYAWMAVLTGIALDRLLQRYVAGEAALWLLAAVQLAAHLYRPAEIPTGNLSARMAFLQALRSTPGDVWVVDHSYDAVLAGKPLHADMDALDAVLGRGYTPALTQFRALSEQGGSLSAVVLDRVPEAYQPAGLFTTPPFSSVYRLRAIPPGAGSPGDLDQPLFTLMPCTPAYASGGLTDISSGFTDHSACPH